MSNTIRLSRLRLHWVQVPLHEPFKISNGEVSLKDAVLVEIQGENGNLGWEEASPMGGSFYSSETPESTWEFLRSTAVPGLLERALPEASRCCEWLAQFPGEPFAKAGEGIAPPALSSRKRLDRLAPGPARKVRMAKRPVRS